MSSYPNWIFSIFAFLGFLLSVIPLPWHLEAWNTGTCLFMMWTSFACLNQFINSIVWNGNALNWAPIWCDISSRFIVGSSVAIPAASLCINRRLYYIATANVGTITKAEKRSSVMVDLSIGLGIPLLEMILQYVAQGHRFNIFEDIGCYPFTYNTWVAYVLVVTWPLAIGCVSAVFCTLSIRSFNGYRRRFKASSFTSSEGPHILSICPTLHPNRYWRLMCLAASDIVCTIPLSSYSIYLNVTSQSIKPWKGWSDTHSDFSRVELIPSVVWHLNRGTIVSLETSRWFVVLCAIIFFGFFGFAEEARQSYRAMFNSLAKRIGLSFGSSFTYSNGPKSKTFVSSTPDFARARNSLGVFTVGSTGSKVECSDESTGGNISCRATSLADAGGALAGYQEASPTVVDSGDEFRVEISSMRHLSVTPISILEPALDISNVHRVLSP